MWTIENSRIISHLLENGYQFDIVGIHPETGIILDKTGGSFVDLQAFGRYMKILPYALVFPRYGNKEITYTHYKFKVKRELLQKSGFQFPATSSSVSTNLPFRSPLEPSS